MTLKNVIASSLVIALGAILILHFILFWMYGGVFIYESNKVILSIETVMSLAIFSFGVERLLNSATESYKRETPATSPDKGQVYTEHVTSPSFLRASENATTSTNTAATTTPRITALLTESGTDHTENTCFEMPNCTQAAGIILIPTPDAEHESGAHTEAV